MPEALREARKAPERVLFSAQTEHRDSVTAADFSHPSLPTEVAEVFAAEAREMMGDLGLTGAESKGLVQAMRAHTATAVSPGACIDALNAEFGQSAKQAAEAARQMVQRDPRLVQMLGTNGMGSNPQVVLAIARAAMRQRSNLPGRK